MTKCSTVSGGYWSRARTCTDPRSCLKDGDAWISCNNASNFAQSILTWPRTRSRDRVLGLSHRPASRVHPNHQTCKLQQCSNLNIAPSLFPGTSELAPRILYPDRQQVRRPADGQAKSMYVFLTRHFSATPAELT
jgi:hypothetical protein